MMILGQQFRFVSETPGDLVQNRAVKFSRHLLGQHGGPQSLLPNDFASIRFQRALQEAEKRRLSGAIAA
jgi:hypothetical protein